MTDNELIETLNNASESYSSKPGVENILLTILLKNAAERIECYSQLQGDLK